jgi:sulfur-oxidizing protein SoxX
MQMKMRRRACGSIALAGVLTLAVSAAWADTVKYEIVDGTAIAASLTGQAGDAANGKMVFLDRKKGNCLACHVVSSLSDQPFHGEVGPPLDGIADRMSPEELRLRVVNPKVVNEDTIMPAFYRTDGFERVLKEFEGKSILSAQEVEDVLAYLQTMKE